LCSPIFYGFGLNFTPEKLRLAEVTLSSFAIWKHIDAKASTKQDEPEGTVEKPYWQG